MTKIISVYNQKGGAGKTTTTMQLAGTFIKSFGFKVLVIDLDPQGSANTWSTQNQTQSEFIPVHHAHDDEDIFNKVAQVAKDYDFIIFDCPPSVASLLAKRSVIFSDLCIIPFAPSAQDVSATNPVIKFANEQKEKNPNLMIRGLVNMYQNTLHANTMVETMEERSDFELLKTKLNLRVAFKDSFLIGGTAHDMPNAKPAIEEAQKLAIEIMILLGVDKHGKKNK